MPTLLKMIQLDSGYTADVQEQAVIAIAEICRHNKRNQTDIIGKSSSVTFIATSAHRRESGRMALSGRTMRACVDSSG